MCPTVTQARGAAEPSTLLFLWHCSGCHCLEPPPTNSSSTRTIFSLCQFELCWPSPCWTGVWVSAGLTEVKAAGCRFSQGRDSLE